MSTTRFPNGVTNVASSNELGLIGQPSRLVYYEDFNDFNVWDSSRYTVTAVEAGAGSASQALTETSPFGVLRLTNDDADDDSTFVQGVEGFRLTPGKKAFFAARMKVSTNNSDFYAGLIISDTTPLPLPTDAVFFRKSDGALNMELVVVKDSTATTTQIFDAVASNTFYSMAWVYDGKSEIKAYWDGVHVATSGVDNLPDDTELAVSFGCQNGGAGARQLDVDYVYGGVER